MVSALSVYPPGARIRESAAPKKNRRTATQGRQRKKGRQAGATAFWLVDDDVTCFAFETLRTTSSHHTTSHPRIASSIDFDLHWIHIIPSIHTIHSIPLPFV
jgi:hypothetical protein